MKEIGIIAFTQRGMALAEQVRACLPEGCRGEVCSDKSEARNWLTANFQKKDTFLFICAAGIAVRYIAPLIRSKDVDPAVVVKDEFGRYAVPIPVSYTHLMRWFLRPDDFDGLTILMV